jgi:hypothetical protein
MPYHATKIVHLKQSALLILLVIFCMQLFAQPKILALPKPDRKGGMPLMEALDRRCTTREFSGKELSE